jgi:phenylacetate-CoA ligase
MTLENRNMADTLDSLETRAPKQRERELMAACRSWSRAPTGAGLGAHPRGVNADITSRAALASCR